MAPKAGAPAVTELLQFRVYQNSVLEGTNLIHPEH